MPTTGITPAVTGRLPDVGVTQNAKSKAQAAVSEADAQVKKLESQLASAESKAKMTNTGDSIVDKITSAPLVKENTEFLRRKTGANSAEAKAQVDRISATTSRASSWIRAKWSSPWNDSA